MTIFDKVRRAIREFRLIAQGDTVVAAVSGGPDSLAMLDILDHLRDEFSFQLHVVHLNHRIREEAGREAEFVRNFSENRQIPVTILEYDIPGHLAESGGSLQEAAREVRYRLFQEVAERVGADSIALGHHADDLAETVMMRFLRGAGLEGLVGFTPRSRGHLIRPLIYVTRSEIEAYCAERELTPCTDPSNAKAVYARNRIRLELLPQLEAEYNPNLRRQLVQMAHLLDEENRVLEELAYAEYGDTVIAEEQDVIFFHFAALAKKKPPILRRILRVGMEKLKGNKKNLYLAHYLQMQELILQGGPGKMLNLPDGYLLYRGYRTIRLGKAAAIWQEPLGHHLLTVPGTIYLPEADLEIQAEIVDGPVIVTGQRVALDADRLGKTLLIRSREPGDAFYPLGVGGKQKVKDYLINEKVERFQRDLLPIVTTETGEIVWIAGLRLDERFKVTSKTRKICILSILKEVCKDEE